jgi:dihydrofolate reductase
MMIFGSGTLVSALAPPGLIDEYRVVINPVVLGRGKPLFREIVERIDLQLLKTRTLACGDVILYYRPSAKG